MTQTALVLVDVQNDFCPGGTLAVTDGDQVVMPLNQMVRRARREGWVIVASRDWHPPVTSHFDTWPVHCVADTPGAAFHPDLDTADVVIVSKGTLVDEDAYSAFQGTTPRGLPLAPYLRFQGVTRVLVGGLATDYCVKATALDAMAAGFETVLLLDACRAVNLTPGDGDEAILAMAAAGVELATASGF